MSVAPSLLAAQLALRTANARYVSLHVSDPGSTGEWECNGEQYRRQPVTWDADGAMASNTGYLRFVVPTGQICYVGYWNAQTGGTYAECAYTEPITAEEGDTYEIAPRQLALVQEG